MVILCHIVLLALLVKTKLLGESLKGSVWRVIWVMCGERRRILR
uniref:Uncharacterized protein n=1 Tax=Candidatus Kentrum sp. UNK TaxID=2126344 RepID=A0A451AI23_9GAMM|nr:MAG: hypothetical protein BECKUNK1418G_GA0071005_106720 [Candidatus Kentron sp. UNK]VFK68973.1 MAG: hypothetical protein BECKUNK1418H_GA0071006_100847 [Candidatus Kentron sp. UNK]